MEDELDYFFASIDEIEDALIAENDELLLQLINERTIDFEIHMDRYAQIGNTLEILFYQSQNAPLEDIEMDASDPISSLKLEKGQICYIMDACESGPVAEDTIRKLIQYNTTKNPFTGLDIISLKRIRIC